MPIVELVEAKIASSGAASSSCFQRPCLISRTCGHRLDHDLGVGDAFLQLDGRMDAPEGGVAVLLAESALLDPALEQPLGVGDALLQCLHPTREHPHR